jgi:predicted  nucleic acid-binding Zn-ribbon protein
MSSLDPLLELQHLDTQIDQLRHRLSHDAVHGVLTASQEQLRAVQAQVADAEARREEIRRLQKRYEDESATVGEKIDKETAKLYGGTVTAHKELEALQAEIDMLRARQSSLDDQVIEQMEIAEPVDAELAELGARLRGAGDAVEGAQGDVTVMQAEIGADLERAEKDRAALAGTLDGGLLDTYEKLRARLGGQGAAHLAPGGRCEGCHLTLPSADYAAVKRAPADEMVFCPECGRILVR